MQIGSLPAFAPQTAAAQAVSAQAAHHPAPQTAEGGMTPSAMPPLHQPRPETQPSGFAELFRPDPLNADHYAEYGPLAALFLPATADPVLREQRAYLMSVLYPEGAP